MIADLKPYAEYKESGLPWLGQVPGHWNVRRMKSAVMNVIEQTFEMRSDEVYVALEHVESWTGKVRPQSDSSLFTGEVKRFRKGDVLFGKLRPYLAKVTRIGADGVCAGEFFVLRPTDKAVSSAYLERQLRSKHTIDVINGSTFGAKMPRADWQFCGNLLFPLPPLAEQAAIVRFLDWANGRLERAIRAKRKVIALLNEQKQAIIHRAVTRGLDPSVPLKPSGIPWLGDIPQHWEVRRAKQLCAAIIDCKNRTPDLVEGGKFVVVRTTNIRHGNFTLMGSYSTDRRNHEIWTQRGAPSVGDVFFTREAPVGEACLVPDRSDLCMGQRMMYFRPNPAVLDAGFLLSSIYGPVVRRYIEIEANGSTVGHLRLGQVSGLPLLWCPINEQKEIVAHIANESAPLNVAISRLNREIDLLREYRTRLVADVVTGKLDVREAAARLPIKAAPDTVEDDTDPSIDPEAADEDPVA